MAEKRMFSKKITESDTFLDMPPTTQNLYFHLSMNADDDGFVDKPKSVMRMIGATTDDLKILITKSFLIPFENGVVVIKHWRINNYIRSDRYHPTIYLEELQSLSPDETGAYTSGIPSGIPNGYQMDTENRLDKISIDKSSIDNNICPDEQDNNSISSKPTRHKYGEYKNVLLSDEELDKLKSEFPTNWDERIERLSCYIASTGKKYKNHLATIRNWARKDSEKGEVKNGAYNGTAESGETSKYPKIGLEL